MLNELLNKNVFIECIEDYEYEGTVVAVDEAYDLIKLVLDADTVYINLKHIIAITVNDEDEEDDGEERPRGFFGKR